MNGKILPFVALLVVLHSSCGAIPKFVRPGYKEPTLTPTRQSDYGRIFPNGWETTPIQLHFDARMPLVMREGIIGAADAWNQAVGFELLKFGPDILLNEVGSLWVAAFQYNRSATNVEWIKNAIVQTPRLARTYFNGRLEFATADNIHEALIVFNESSYFFTKIPVEGPDDVTTIDPSRWVDTKTLALHELGHVIGLSHNDFNGSVMGVGVRVGIESEPNSSLTAEDVALARSIYVPNSLPPRPPPEYN